MPKNIACAILGLTSLRLPEGAFQMWGKKVRMMWSSISGSIVCSRPLPAEGPLLPVRIHAILEHTCCKSGSTGMIPIHRGAEPSLEDMVPMYL